MPHARKAKLARALRRVQVYEGDTNIQMLFLRGKGKKGTTQPIRLLEPRSDVPRRCSMFKVLTVAFVASYGATEGRRKVERSGGVESAKGHGYMIYPLGGECEMSKCEM